MLDLGFLLLLALWAAGAGLWLLRRFGPTPESLTDAFALALPLGLGALGLATLALGELGELDHGRLETVLAGGAILAGLALARATMRYARTKPLERPVFEWPDRALAIVTGAALASTLLTALTPVTDGDALCYHLQVPKWFLERGAVGFDPDLHETVYPLLTEMLYAVGLAFRGPIACRLIQWLLGVGFALNVTALARPSLGPRAWWAGVIALLVPAITNGMSAPLNDVALAAYGTAALHAWSRFRDAPSLRAAALTGAFTGLAMGVKYPALVLAGLLGLAVAPGLLSRVFFRLSTGGAGMPLVGTRLARRRLAQLVDRWTTSIETGEAPRRRRFIHLFVFVAFAWMIGGVWYVRALVHTGNPVHPFFRHAFGGAGLDEVLAPEKRPLPVDPAHLLTSLVSLTLEPDRFDSFSHQFGPVFLLFLPALLWERPNRRVLGLAAIGYGFLMICMTQRQSMRFLLIAVSPLSVAVAWLARSWWERRTLASRALVGALVACLAFESALALARTRHGWKVALGLESVDHYLVAHEPTYRVGQWIDDNLPGSARIIGQDHRGFYIPRDYTMELAHRRRTGVGRTGSTPEAILQDLRASGYTHLMLCPPQPENAVEFDPTLGRTLSPWLVHQQPLYHQTLTDGDGVARDYAIYALTDERVSLHDAPHGAIRR